MNIFETLLEIKTGRKNLPVNVVCSNHIAWKKGIYFVYYYDNINHSFYINSIKNSSRDCIEQIIDKAYKQQLGLFKEIYIYKKPKVFNVSIEKITWMLVIKRLNMKVIRDKQWNITKFKK